MLIVNENIQKYLKLTWVLRTMSRTINNGLDCLVIIPKNISVTQDEFLAQYETVTHLTGEQCSQD